MTGKSLLMQAPRVLGLLFAGFVGMFALDAFTGEYGLLDTMLAFAMHLMPAYLVAGTTLMGWRWPFAGALGFFALAAGYAVLAWGHFPWSTILVMSGPAAVIGGLFLRNALNPPHR